MCAISLYLSLLFTCSHPVLLYLPSSMIIMLCYVSRKNLLWTISLYFYISENCLAQSWSINNNREDLTCSLGFQTALQRNGACPWGKFTRSKKCKNFWVNFNSFVRPLFSKKEKDYKVKRDTHLCLTVLTMYP